MNLSELKWPSGARKRRRRIGRGVGSGRGKTSGKGQKGQRMRSGQSLTPGFEGGQMPLIRRLPKRGFHNKFRTSYNVVNVGQLSRLQEGKTIKADTLRRAGIVSRRGPIKLLAKGEIDRALVVEVDRASRAAREKVERAGGRVVEGRSGA